MNSNYIQVVTASELNNSEGLDKVLAAGKNHVGECLLCIECS